MQSDLAIILLSYSARRQSTGSSLPCNDTCSTILIGSCAFWESDRTWSLRCSASVNRVSHHAGSDRPDRPPPTPKERFDALVKEYTSAEGKWTERYRSDDTPAAREESLLRYRDWPAWAFMPRFMELAEKNPKDAAAIDALLWIVDQGQAIGLNDKDYYPLLERAARTTRACSFAG